jgi:hypothetical protein
VQSVVVRQPKMLPVLTGGEVVEAEWQPSGVAGLALAGRPVTTGWRLVHIASGRAVSRSAEHPDPDILRELAMRIAHLADWTQPRVAVSIPRLRKELEQAVSAWRISHPLSDEDLATPPEGVPVLRGAVSNRPVATHGPSSKVSLVGGPETELGKDLERDLATLVERLRVAEHERVVLRQVVRRLYATMAPDAFTKALATLSHADHSFVRFLVADEKAEDATAVVQAIRPRPAAAPPRPAAGTQGVSPKRRPPRFGGPDVAAS